MQFATVDPVHVRGFRVPVVDVVVCVRHCLGGMVAGPLVETVTDFVAEGTFTIVDANVNAA